MMRPVTSSPALERLRQWMAAKWEVAKWPFRWTRMTSSQSDSSMLKRHLVPQDAGVVDQDVELAPGVDGLARPGSRPPPRS